MRQFPKKYKERGIDDVLSMIYGKLLIPFGQVKKMYTFAA
jgi:hypothetical protein